MKTFRGWLRDRIEESSPIGDLARDAFSDGEWSGRTAKSLSQELERCGACSNAERALEQAVKLYEMHVYANNKVKKAKQR